MPNFDPTPSPEWQALAAQLAAESDPDARAELSNEMHLAYLAEGRGAVAANSLPYPNPTDPISQGADAIRSLAQAIQGNLLGYVNRLAPTGTEWVSGGSYALIVGMTINVVTQGPVLCLYDLGLFATSAGGRNTNTAVALDGAVITGRSNFIAAGAYGFTAGVAKLTPSVGVSHRIEIWANAAASNAVNPREANLMVLAVAS